MTIWDNRVVVVSRKEEEVDKPLHLRLGAQLPNEEASVDRFVTYRWIHFVEF